MVMEHQSLEEVYSYYDTKIKIMSALEKRSFEQLEAEGGEEDDEEIVAEAAPTKKIDNKDGVEVHNRLFESEKKSNSRKTSAHKELIKPVEVKKVVVEEVVQIRKEEVKTSVSKGGKMQIETTVEVREEVKEKGLSDVDISDMPALVFDDDE